MEKACFKHQIGLLFTLDLSQKAKMQYRLAFQITKGNYHITCALLNWPSRFFYQNQYSTYHGKKGYKKDF